PLGDPGPVPPAEHGRRRRRDQSPASRVRRGGRGVNEAAVLAAYAGIVGLAVPRFLRRARWTHRAPRLAIGVWSGLLMSCTAALALLLHHLAAPRELLHHGPLRFLHSCAEPDAVLYSGPGSDAVQMFAPLAVATWPLVWSATALGRARLRRRAHAGMLDLV